MADRHHELPGADVVVDAVDHAPAAEGQALAFVILRAGGHGVTELEESIAREDQTMAGGSQHAGHHTPMARDGHTNRRQRKLLGRGEENDVARA